MKAPGPAAETVRLVPYPLAVPAMLACVLAIFPATSLAAAEETDDPAGGRIQFNRDIRPILSDRCYSCHGPDSGSREAELRLDLRQAAIAGRDGSPAIVPGKPAGSLLLQRVLTQEVHERMPPRSAGPPLTPAQIQTLRRWIAEGAEYEDHWSFIAPRRPVPPAVELASRVNNPIDQFVLARLKQQGWQPSPPADRTTLIRRVTLDLTGQPPSLDEVDAFLADDQPGAFERVVDRLLASPRYGERMAVEWLDAARFADTNGYFTDEERPMWRWRDWVIRAYNHNLPYDQFTVEQLAGDLLEQPTLDQLIATGFNRNHMVNNETGIIDEEYRVEYVVDRISTTSTVWMGLTAGCARCHDHKFDPLPQRDFYRLFAFFNNGPEQGLAVGTGVVPPTIPINSPAWLAQRDRLQQQAATARERAAQLEPEVAAAQSRWEQAVQAELSKAEGTIAAENAEPAGAASPSAHGLIAHYPFEAAGTDTSGHGLHATAVGQPEFTDGLLGQALTLDGDSLLEGSRDLAAIQHDRPFSFGGWMNLTTSRPVCLISKSDEQNSLRGFEFRIRKSRAAVHLVHRWNSSAIHVETVGTISRNRWQHILVTYDGSGRAAGVRVYLDGEPAALEIKIDSLNGSIQNQEPLRIGRSSTSAPFIGSLDDVRLYNRSLSAEEVRQLAEGQFLRSVLSRPADTRSEADGTRLRQLFLSRQADDSWQTVIREAEELTRQAQRFASRQPTVMVMQELAQPRETFVLNRGEYDQPLDKVTPGVPGSLPPLPGNAPPNRLGLARWLVDPAHPLTARVAVNRLWQLCFGRGIVSTVADFGSQGELPTHPALLDWLAVEFMESGWDVKHIVRLIVTSSTYQQSSRITPEQLSRDPENRLLARGARFRMNAEMLRDNALAVSGLLVERHGGPSVRPYQPKGLWKAVSYDAEREYVPDTGANLYRRSLYTFWKRQSPPPAMLAFDAPTRESCVVSRSRTSTPLQALVLLNDPTWVEAARALATRTMREVDSASPRELVRHAFRLATARSPQPQEIRILLDVFVAQQAEFRDQPAEARKLLSVGESPVDPSLDMVELAAWTTVMQMILSLDETLTKE